MHQNLWDKRKILKKLTAPTQNWRMRLGGGEKNRNPYRSNIKKAVNAGGRNLIRILLPSKRNRARFREAD
jgi:hypothetical protein